MRKDPPMPDQNLRATSIEAGRRNCAAGHLSFSSLFLPIVCRSFAEAVPLTIGNVHSHVSAKVDAISDYGKKRPNGRKIVELRKEKGLKQEGLADGARISVRLLRDIERNNHPVPTTTITAIA